MFLSVGDYSCLSEDNQLSWLAQDQGVSSELRWAQSFFVSYLFLAVLGLRCCSQAFLVAASGGCSLAPVASCRGARAPGCRPQWLWCTAYLPFGVWDLPDRESNPCPPRWQVGSYPLDHRGSPLEAAFGIPILWIRTTRFNKVQSIPLNHTNRNLGGRLHPHTLSAVYTNPLLPDLGGPRGCLCR